LTKFLCPSGPTQGQEARMSTQVGSVSQMGAAQRRVGFGAWWKIQTARKNPLAIILTWMPLASIVIMFFSLLVGGVILVASVVLLCVFYLRYRGETRRARAQLEGMNALPPVQVVSAGTQLNQPSVAGQVPLGAMYGSSNPPTFPSSLQSAPTTAAQLPVPPPAPSAAPMAGPERTAGATARVAQGTGVVVGKIGHGLVEGVKGFGSGARRGFKGSDARGGQPETPPRGSVTPSLYPSSGQPAMSPPVPPPTVASQLPRPPPPPPTAAPATPFCTTCGKPTNFIAEYGRYYCYSCTRYA
jgi:hypothetical protein